MKKLLLVLLISIPFTVFGKDISGTGWKFNLDSVAEIIILFECDGTFTYLNVINNSGNESKVFSEDGDTWTIDGNKVVISFTNGYTIATLTINNNGDSMSGTAINEVGLALEMNGKLIK